MANTKKLTAQQKKELAQKQKKKEILIVGIVAAVVLVAVLAAAVLSGMNTVTPTSGDETPTATQPQEHNHDHNRTGGDGATLQTAQPTHYVTIEIRDYGTIRAELYGKTAPVTVANFVALAESGFYDGLTFHRIIEGFMMQGGAPDADSPAVTPIEGEFAENHIDNNLLHTRGVLSMARTEVLNSATSQFFIVHETSPHLDGDYAAFGLVTEGIEVVDAICESARPIDGNGGIAPEDQPVIESVTVTEA